MRKTYQIKKRKLFWTNSLSMNIVNSRIEVLENVDLHSLYSRIEVTVIQTQLWRGVKDFSSWSFHEPHFGYKQQSNKSYHFLYFVLFHIDPAKFSFENLQCFLSFRNFPTIKKFTQKSLCNLIGSPNVVVVMRLTCCLLCCVVYQDMSNDYP